LQIDVQHADRQDATAPVTSRSFAGQKLQNAPPRVDARELVVLALLEAPAQVEDVAAHEREPDQYRGQHHPLEDFDVRTLEAVGGIEQQRDHERVAHLYHGAREQECTRIQSEYAEKQDHRKHQQKHRPCRADVVQRVRHDAGGAQHHRHREAAVFRPFVESRPERGVEHQNHRDHACRGDHERTDREHAFEHAKGEQANEHQRSTGGDQIAPKSQRLPRVVVWKQERKSHFR
jgi:hypothetical protein